MQYVTGGKLVLKNIDREFENIRGRTTLGMVKALKHLEKQMDTTRPLVPIDTRFMRGSWYIYPSIFRAYIFGRNKNNIYVEAGYNAPYAPHVHENLNAVNWTRPGSGPKWLQVHFERSRMEMELIIASHAKIPKE